MVEGASETPTPTQEIKPEPRQENYFLYIAGALGTRQGIQGINKALKKTFKSEQVSTINSVLNFTDKPDSQRFDRIAADIVDQIINGKRVNLIAHSFGAVELDEIVDTIQKKHAQKYSEVLKNLDLLLIGPAGFFESFSSGGWSFIKRFIEVARTQLPLPIEKLKSKLQGIESTSLIPLQNMDLYETVYCLKKAFPEATQYQEGFTSIELPKEAYFDYQQLLSDSEKTELTKVDKQIKIAAQQNNWILFRQLVRQRGDLLTKPMTNAYEGSNFELVNNEKATVSQLITQAIPQILPLIKSTLSGKPLKRINELKDAGVKVKFLVPEYDVIVTVEEIKQFFNLPDEEITSKLAFLSGFTHASFAFQGEAISKAVQQFQDEMGKKEPSKITESLSE